MDERHSYWNFLTPFSYSAIGKTELRLQAIYYTDYVLESYTHIKVSPKIHEQFILIKRTANLQPYSLLCKTFGTMQETYTSQEAAIHSRHLPRLKRPV